jgi:predicted CopG family antitoxin
MVKTITIRDEVYKKLVSAKKKDESFSELFERLTGGTDSVETLKRIRGTVEFREKDKLLAELNTKRAEHRL